jgi:uncharacterized membrane protein
MDNIAQSNEADFVPCVACHQLDGTDGVLDGAFGIVAKRVHTEHGFRLAFHRAGNRTADRITKFAGSMRFVYLHLVWFGIWIVLNVGLAGLRWEFDKFPFGLLTMVVSLEAIFLATFVMISQNRQGARADLRSEIDFENNLRAEVWSVHIGHRLGIDADHVEALVQKALVDNRNRMNDAV